MMDYSKRHAAAAIAAVWVSAGICDTDVWQFPVNQHYYKQYVVNLSQQGAYRLCKAHGGYVVSVGTAQENEFLSGMLRSTGVKSTMIGLTITKRVMTEKLGTLVGYELYGKWADGQRFKFTYNDADPVPPARNSFQAYNVLPDGAQAHMNAQGVWTWSWLGPMLTKSAVESSPPYRTETYTLSRGVSSVTCEWDTEPSRP